jgi:hypothetical protein
MKVRAVGGRIVHEGEGGQSLGRCIVLHQQEGTYPNDCQDVLPAAALLGVPGNSLYARRAQKCPSFRAARASGLAGSAAS